MSILMIDPELAAKLEQAEGGLQLCTRDGRVVGYFSPARAKALQPGPPETQLELHTPLFAAEAAAKLQQLLDAERAKS